MTEQPRCENADRFARLSNEIPRTIWQLNPVDATALGIHDYDDTLGDVSAEAFHSYANTLKAQAEALRSDVNPSLLDDEQSLDYQLALSLASTNYVALECQRSWMNNPASYLSLGIWGCFALLLREFAPFEERASSMLSRMREIPNMLRMSKANIPDPPRVFVDVAIEVLRGGVAFFRNAVPKIAAEVPTLQNDLLKANDAAISAFDEYERWLREAVLPHADGRFAVGRDVYEQLLDVEHRLACSPDEIVLLGEKLLKDTTERIQEAAARIDPCVGWQDLVMRLKLEHPSKNTLADAYKAAIQSARDFVLERDLVTIPENERLEIRETPEFERSVTPYAAYMPPAAFEASRKGYFWVTPVDESAPADKQEEQLLGHCIYTIPVIALHEAYPGHHLHLTRAVSVKSPLCKQTWSNLSVEGWALYCEEMMHEQGFYTDPRVRLFQLKDLLWRACRAIIDVGLHTGEMTIKDAVQMLVETAHLENINAIAEVKRYAMSPTQPMTYTVGKKLLLDLRSQMSQKLGSRFDLKTFHDQLLSYGPIPPGLISQRMLGSLRKTSSASDTDHPAADAA